MKKKKSVSSKPFLKMIKEMKGERNEMQQRVFDFNDQLESKELEHYQALLEIQAMKSSMAELKHLIKMYDVMDQHRVLNIWELEKACGLTDKPYLQWKHEFEKTKEGFTFKTSKGEAPENP